MTNHTILVGDCIEKLRTLPDKSVHCCITSPPYFGLRDYGTASWEGGDPGCDHKGPPQRTRANVNQNTQTGTDDKNTECRMPFKEKCGKCGAIRVDKQIGLEETPRQYVERIVEVMREIRRVLRDDGTLWLNLGDSYNTQQAGNRTPSGFSQTRPSRISGNGDQETVKHGRGLIAGLKPKDLIGIPWRVAFALQADGWWLRQDIIWHKPNPMPESVTDRCTKSHEYLFLLTKSDRYFFDNDAIKEPHQWAHVGSMRKGTDSKNGGSVSSPTYGKGNTTGSFRAFGEGGRNKRSVWSVPTQPCKDAHFATFPKNLIQPCILAGTSEAGCCPSCGKPWVRAVSKTKIKRERPNSLTKRTGESGTGNFCPNDVAGVSTKTTGWEPSCKCGCEKPVPCTVLDPFMGAGTTAIVAIQHGRRAVGCELNPEYARIAERRIAKECGLLANTDH